MGLMANYGIGGFSDAVYYARRGMRITRWIDSLIFGAPMIKKKLIISKNTTISWMGMNLNGNRKR